MAVGLSRAVTLQEALYWMNIQLELLVADQRALKRMRNVITVHEGDADGFARDVELLVIEVDRIADRLRYWEGVIAGFRPGHR
jgi:hypothetical protein